MKNAFYLAGIIAISSCFMACGSDSDPSEKVAVPRDEYPFGPFGIRSGQIIENLSFINADNEEVDFQSLRADGSKSLLLLSTAAGWCSACIEEQPKLQSLYQEFQADGLEIAVALFEDARYKPATPKLAAEWKERFSLSFPVLADFDFVLSSYYDTDSTPMNMLIDLDSMKIHSIRTGFDESAIHSLIEALL